MKEINLEEILNERLELSKYGLPELDSDQYDNIVYAMREAVKQALELAAENAEVEYDVEYKETIDCEKDMYIVNKQSILDTINQVI